MFSIHEHQTHVFQGEAKNRVFQVSHTFVSAFFIQFDLHDVLILIVEG